MDGDDGRGGDGHSFSDKLCRLFDTVRDQNGQPYTGKRIAARANALGYSVSDAYISQLRTGKARTPSFRTVEGIARAFEVSVTYFLSNPEQDVDRVRRQQDYVQLLAVTRGQLANVDLGSLCPDTIEAMIGLLKVLKTQAELAADRSDNGTGAA
ncbi:helix-turn-helix domain-containing protein [Gordonia sp. NPDC003376]